MSAQQIVPDKKKNSNLYSKPKFLAVKYFSNPKKNVILEPNFNNEETFQNDNKTTQNIFAIAKVIETEYEMTSKGPKSNEKGVLLPHSILGKVDWYKNYLVTKENENKIQVTTFSDAPENQKVGVRPMTSYLSNQTKTAFSTQQRPFSSKLFSEKKNLEDSHKKIEKIGTILKKEEVLEEIKKIKGRVYRQNQNNSTRKIPLSAKFFQSKEKNCLNHFEELETKWETQSRFYSNKLSRNHLDKPLFEKGDFYRQKLELAQLVDNLKTDHEKFGDRYWELTLRKYDIQSILDEKSPKDNIKSLKSHIIKKTNVTTEKIRPISAQIESIRNPKKHYNEMPFSSFKSDNYLKTKLEGLEEKISEMHPLIKSHDINSFYVEKNIKSTLNCIF